jgi:putative pyruvate formate lyase activating enzyme
MKSNHQVTALKEIYKDCILCPRQCHVDRTRGDIGYCRLPAKIIMDCAQPHHGEEPPLSGIHGAGTIFFSSCNLGCIYCQNYQISHNPTGKELDVSELARIMLDLQKRGCHNIEPVTPTPQTPLIMEALLSARSKGLHIPFVYNCGGYEDARIIKMLEKMVDIYLPDFKYAIAKDAMVFSEAPDYPGYVLDSVKEMVRQVGDELEMENGIALRGVIVRHLVLPGLLENSREVFRHIKKGISTSISISIMSQYTPVPRVQGQPMLGRRLTVQEYNQVVSYAFDLGFENLFVQEVNEFSLTPDFDKENPFG